MPRPLKEFNIETIDDYERKMENAELTGNKEELKRTKRLFKEYIKKRKLTLRDFTKHPIRSYFTENKKSKMRPDKELKKRQDQREYRKRKFIIDRVKKDYDSKIAKDVSVYLKKILLYKKECKKMEEIGFPKEKENLYYQEFKQHFGLDKINAEPFEKIIKVYETEYNERVKTRNKNVNRKRLYVIKRLKEDNGEGYVESITDWVNDYFNNDLKNDIDDCGTDEIIFYEMEYENRYRNIKEKHFYIIDKINEVFENDFTDLLLDYFQNKIQTDNPLYQKVLKELKKYVSKYENEYNNKNKNK